MSKSRIILFIESELIRLNELYKKGIKKKASKSYLENIKKNIIKQQDKLGLIKKVVK